MIGSKQGEVLGVVMEGWGAWWVSKWCPCEPAPTHTQHRRQPQPPPWRDSPWVTARGLWGFKQPFTTCLALTPTAAVTCLFGGCPDGRLNSWLPSIGNIHITNIRNIHKFKTHASISQGSSHWLGDWGLLKCCILCVGFSSLNSDLVVDVAWFMLHLSFTSISLM